MERVINYILGGIVSILFILLLLSQSCNSEKDKDIASLQKTIYEMVNAPVRVDTIYDTITLPSKIIYYPKPSIKPKEYVRVQEVTGTKCDSVSSVYYSESYKEKGVSLHWEALTSCDNDSAKLEFIRFDNIIVPKEIITQTKEIKTSVEVEKKLKSKFLLYGGLFLNNINSFPGMEGGVGYLHKQNWMMMGGPSFVEGKIYGTLKIGITF